MSPAARKLLLGYLSDPPIAKKKRYPVDFEIFVI